MFVNVNSLNFKLKIGLVLILLLFISAIFFPILCQNKKIAIVSINNQSGKFDNTSLAQITFLLNNQPAINDVIILGDLTADGSLEELNQIYKALEKLKLPYHIIGGFNDHFGNFNHGTFISQLFDSDEFILHMNNILILGLNCAIQYTTETGIIKIESLNKIKEQSDLNKIRTVFIFSNYSQNNIQNRNDLMNLFPGKLIFFFSPTSKGFSAQSDGVTNIFDIEIPISISDSPNYFLIQEEQDTLFISSKSTRENTPEIKTKIAVKDINTLNKPVDKVNTDLDLTQINQIDFNSSTTIPLIVDDNKIFTTLNNGLVYRNDFNGKEKFVSELTGNVYTNPVHYKDLFLVSTIQGDLYSLNSNNGEMLQVVGIGENITSDLALTDVDTQTLKSKAVIFGTLEGNIFCYDAFTFELLWEKNISTLPIVFKPTVVDDKIIFLNSASSLYCVNSKSGSLIWKYEFNDNQNFSSKFLPLCDGKSVISISPDGNLFATDLLSGKKKWSINSSDILNQLYISPDNQRLIMSNSKGLITFVAFKDGKEIQRLDFKKSGLFSFIIAENEENIFVGFSDGSLYSVNSKYNIKQFISQTNIPITSINAIDKDRLIVKDINGKITFYKTR